ncbi:hypothetical protein MtrunA17_Chr7g0241951 [Medicago truncatula]|uniref:DUF247 domain protein n=1 Tax=Medicago truncatula TaxID=3880 RepID=G7KRB7_MEDTR|nr:uncharacterized protein LOC11405516 [Medicago truncatula]AES79459.1 DUF247 domain protein [Medicago truncatula]RHN46415.1 hypothetical protein MtrunA17_Chr7g0241951 [Medicago truncatula]
MDDQFKEWCHSFAASLGSLEFYSHHQSRSIFLVPERLKKPNVDAYMPRVVSIGPRFKGSNEDLLQMEDIKIRCMKHLFQRGILRDRSAYETLESCCKALWEIDDVIRANYGPDINNIETQELTQIMLVDGCFLLELLIEKGLYEVPESVVDSPFFPGPAIELLRDEDVLSDLTLLENQIPIRIIYLLLRTLFPELTGYSTSEGETKINNLILFVLGYRQGRILDILDIRGYHPGPVLSIHGDHILDIVNLFVNWDFDQYGNFLDLFQFRDAPQQHQLKLNRCALRLLTAGVIIKARFPEHHEEYSNFNLSLVWRSLCGLLNSIFLVNERGRHLDLDYIHQEVELKCLNFHFKFEKGKLEIEQLHITKTTKAKWCNLIAWEHLQSNLRSTTRRGSGNCKFTSAALIFNGLICSEDDVQLLKNKKIVVDHLKMSNRELVEYFRKVALGVDHKVVAYSIYTEMVRCINNSEAFFIKQMWIMVWNSFTCRQEWVVRFLNRNYNFVATVVSVLAVVQTVYTVLPYYFPK